SVCGARETDQVAPHVALSRRRRRVGSRGAVAPYGRRASKSWHLRALHRVLPRPASGNPESRIRRSGHARLVMATASLSLPVAAPDLVRRLGRFDIVALT